MYTYNVTHVCVVTNNFKIPIFARLKYSGPLEGDPKSENLHQLISSEMNQGVPTRLARTLTDNMKGDLIIYSEYVLRKS